MNSKLTLVFLLLISIHLSLSYRLPRAIEAIKNDLKEKSSSSSEEVTDEDINELRQKMEQEKVPAEQIKLLCDIAGKFKKGTTDEQKMEGFIQLMIFAAASESNSDKADFAKIFEDSDSKSKEIKVSA